jgi:selenocysteine lyase/cysteine desulfurase
MLTCKYSKFTLPRHVTYLNCSYLSPMLKSVEKAGLRGLRRKRNPVDIKPEDFFTDSENLRAEFARLVNARDPKRIAIIPSVSYGISTVAKNLKVSRGQHLIVAAEQFPSNYYPWETLGKTTGAEVKVISPENGLRDRGRIWNEKILSSINNNTRAVAIAHTHWADGTRFDLQAIRARTRDVGAMLVVDGTQSVGALPFDIGKLEPDALICAGYKWLLGPYSLGVAYYGEAFDHGSPLEENWISRLNSEDFSGLVTYESNYQPGALRFDVGERSNFILVPMLLNAIGQLNRWHVENVQEYCKSITAGAIATLRDRGCWIEEEPYRGSHIFGIRLPGHVTIERVKESFLKNKIYVSFRGDAIRVSPNVYNDESDLLKLVKALKPLLK